MTFSGGVAEYIYGREAQSYGDLGAPLAEEIRARLPKLGARLERSNEGIRATVIGASQYTTQVSGSTIFVSPLEALPVRNVPVIAPVFELDADAVDAAAVSSAIRAVLRRLDLIDSDLPVAVFVPWRGSATFQRLDGFCRGVVEGLATVLARGHPLVLVGDGDVGGLLGIHLREESRLANPIISVDGLELKEFDYIDIGTMLPNSGAVPVVIKSLIFPSSAAPGREWLAARARGQRPVRAGFQQRERHLPVHCGSRFSTNASHPDAKIVAAVACAHEVVAARQGGMQKRRIASLLTRMVIGACPTRRSRELADAAVEIGRRDDLG